MIDDTISSTQIAATDGSTGLCSAGFSHIGLVRSTNEDRILNDPAGRIFAVADGMGGHSLGDWAANMVIQALLTIEGPQALQDRIEAALARANAAIHAKALAQNVTCGSTIAGLAMGQENGGLVFWAGDSRVYRLRGGALERLSRDHSVVQELLDAGVLNDAEARAHPRSNVITRALGVSSRVEVDWRLVDCVQGDIYLICSDGVTGCVPDDAIESLIGQPLQASLQSLIDTALRCGGKDNISAILVQT